MLRTKSLLTRLLMALCIVFCAAALLFGISACDGADGSDGKDGTNGTNGTDGVSITSVEIDSDGHLIVYLSEGDPIDAGQVTSSGSSSSADECEHDMYEYVLEEATCSEEGVMLQVCKKNCGTAYIQTIPTTDHDWVTTAATCTEDGVRTCTMCGTKEVVETAPGHEWSTVTYEVVEEGVNKCEDIVHYVRICDVCGTAEIVSADQPLGHSITEVYVEVDPTSTSTGEAYGYCENCGEYIDVTLPALTDASVTAGYYTYEVTEEKTSCSDTGTAVYTSTQYIDANTGDYLTFEVTLVATNHVHSEYGEMDTDKVYHLSTYPNLVLAGNSGNIPSCSDSEGEYAQAVFTCTECGQPIIVSVKIAHTVPTDVNGDPVYETAPTCTKAGSYYCAECGELVDETNEEAVPALGHSYVYTLTDNGNDTYTITGVCSVCGDETTSVTVNKSDVTVEEKAATCEETGYQKITYVYDGQEMTLESTIAVLDHSYNGNEIATNTAATAYDYTDSKYSSIPLAGNAGNTLTCSDTAAQAVYTCDDCGQPIIIWVKVPHTAPLTTGGDIDYTYEYTAGVAGLEPTCKDDGYYYCTVCGAQVEVAALGHSYTYTIEDDGTGNNTYEITATCSTCGDTYVVATGVAEADLTITVVKAATCEETGTRTITYTSGNVTATLTETIATTAHILNGVEMDEDEVYTLGEVDGLVQAGNSTPSCSETSGEYGQGVFTCEVCGQPIIVSVKSAHTKPTDASQITTVEATCTSDGSITYTCTVCEEEVTETIAMLGHTYTYTVTSAPDETNAGEIEVTCSVCGETIETITLNALNSTDYTVATAKEATCQSQGAVTYTYTNSKYGITEVFTVLTDKTSHANSDSGITYTWSDETYKYEGYICKYCDQMIVTSKVYLTRVTAVEVSTDGTNAYYVVSGTCDLDDTDTAELVLDLIADGGTRDYADGNSTVVISSGSFTITVDITDIPVGVMLYPHFFVSGEPKSTETGNENGDVKVACSGSVSIAGTDYTTVYTLDSSEGSPAWGLSTVTKTYVGTTALTNTRGTTSYITTASNWSGDVTEGTDAVSVTGGMAYISLFADSDGNTIVHNTKGTTYATSEYTINLTATGEFTLIALATSGITATNNGTTNRAIYLTFSDNTVTVYYSGSGENGSTSAQATASTGITVAAITSVGFVFTTPDDDTGTLTLYINGTKVALAATSACTSFTSVSDGTLNFARKGFGPRLNVVAGESVTVTVTGCTFSGSIEETLYTTYTSKITSCVVTGGVVDGNCVSPSTQVTSLKVEDDKVYYVFSVTYTAAAGLTDADIVAALEETYMDLQGNPYRVSYSWSGDWSRYTFDCVATLTGEGTATIAYDITDLAGYSYTTHFTLVDPDGTPSEDSDYNDLKPLVAYSETVTLNGRTYTMSCVGYLSDDGHDCWGCVMIDVSTAA